MLGGGIEDATNYKAVPGLKVSNKVGWDTSVLNMWHWSDSERLSDTQKTARRREYAWLIRPVCVEWERLVRGN